MSLRSYLGWCKGLIQTAAILAAAWVLTTQGAAPVHAQAPEKKSGKPAADPFAVPDGSAEVLIKYIDELKNVEPSSDSKEAVRDFAKKQLGALQTASEKILAGKFDTDQGKAAVQYKLVALNMLAKMGATGTKEKIAAFRMQLEKLGQKDLLREFRIAEIQSKLAEGPVDKNEFAGILEDVKSCLNDGKLDTDAGELAMGVAMAAENDDSMTASAIQAYQELGKILAKSKDPKVVNMATTMEGAARRLGLVGKKFVVEGSTVTGKPLDWSKYQGKVVLIDFFATWCGPCRAEMKNVAKNYDIYHKRGFEVVSISVDEDRKALVDFLDQEKHPWTVLLDNNEARGTDKSMSTYYGIFSIPQLILVGRDGNVVAMNPRGEKLGEALTKLIGPAASAN